MVPVSTYQRQHANRTWQNLRGQTVLDENKNGKFDAGTDADVTANYISVGYFLGVANSSAPRVVSLLKLR